MVLVKYALLRGKSQTVYTKFLSLLQTDMTNCGLLIYPSTVFLDFETAAQNAFLYSFPGTSIEGCCFHHIQCILRKVQPRGLQMLNRDNENIDNENCRERSSSTLSKSSPLHWIRLVWSLGWVQNADRNVQQWMWQHNELKMTYQHGITMTLSVHEHHNQEAWHGKLKRKIPAFAFKHLHHHPGLQNYPDI